MNREFKKQYLNFWVLVENLTVIKLNLRTSHMQSERKTDDDKVKKGVARAFYGILNGILLYDMARVVFPPSTVYHRVDTTPRMS